MEMFLTNTALYIYIYIYTYSTNKVFILFIPHNIVFSKCLKPIRFDLSDNRVR